MAPLVDALAGRRLFEPRLSGGFAHGRLVKTERGASPRDLPLLVAAERVNDRAHAEPTPANRRAAAVAQLLLGDGDDAVRALEALAAGAADDAAVHTDLAAAYLVTAPGHAENLPRALEAAERAVELQPRSPEALYNRALALEAVGLAEPAREAWRALAPQVAGSGWAADAESHLRSIVPASDPAERARALRRALDAGDAAALRGTMRASVDSAFVFFEEQLLTAPLEARLFLYGTVFREITGDAVIAATAAQRRSATRRHEVDAALALFQHARVLMERFEWSKAGPRMAAAAAALRRTGSPLWGWAALDCAILDLSASRFAPAERALRGLLADPAFRDQPLLRARTLYARSVAAGRQGRWGEALADRTEAHQLFAGAGDLAWAGYMSEQTAEVFSFLGRPSRGWAERLEAVRSADRFESGRRETTAVNLVGDDCRAAGCPRAARRFYQAALDLARRARDPLLVADTLLGMVPALATIDVLSIDRQLASAATAIDAIPDAELRERYRGELLRVRAESEAGPLDVRLRALTAAISWFDARAEGGRSLPLRERRAHLLEGDSQTAAARADMEAIIRLSEGRGLDDVELSSAGLRAALGAFEYLAAADARSGRGADHVLAIADRRWETSFRRRVAPLRPGLAAELRRRVAVDACVLSFLPTEEALLSWSICAGRIGMEAQALSRSTVRTLVDAAVEDSRTGSRTVAIDALRRALLAGQGEDVRSSRRLYVIGSGPLGRVPWSALRPQAADGRFQEVSLAPSLSYLLAAGARGWRPIAPGRALVVAAPDADPDLPRLVHATDEAGAVVALAGGTLLAGTDATRARIEAALPQAALFHFSGHVLVNRERPAQSSLVLSAGAGGGPDYWTLGRVAALRLDGLELAVLSACQSADQAAPDGDAELSVARAFLEAGASSVIGTLWDVSDADMPRISARLHAALLRDRATPAAAMAALLNDQAPADARALVLHSARGALAH